MTSYHDPSQARRHQTTPIETEAKRRTAWRKHGILVVAERDPRLSWPEPKLVRQPGASVHGERRVARHG